MKCIFRSLSTLFPIEGSNDNIWFGTHIPKFTREKKCQDVRRLNLILLITGTDDYKIVRPRSPIYLSDILPAIQFRSRSFHLRPLLGGRFCRTRPMPAMQTTPFPNATNSTEELNIVTLMRTPFPSHILHWTWSVRSHTIPTSMGLFIGRFTVNLRITPIIYFDLVEEIFQELPWP